MIRETVYIAIAGINRRKEEANRHPTHALLAELYRALGDLTRDEVNAALRELLNEGRIEAGRTINDTYLTAK